MLSYFISCTQSPITPLGMGWSTFQSSFLSTSNIYDIFKASNFKLITLILYQAQLADLNLVLDSSKSKCKKEPVTKIVVAEEISRGNEKNFELNWPRKWTKKSNKMV